MVLDLFVESLEFTYEYHKCLRVLIVRFFTTTTVSCECFVPFRFVAFRSVSIVSGYVLDVVPDFSRN